MINYIRDIQAKGLKIDTIYDIGAWQGGWSHSLKAQTCPNSQFILFEANPAYESVLQNCGFPAFNIALSNPGREFVDFYNGTNTGDSYYKETTAHYDNQQAIKLPCYTLDEIIKKYNLPIPQFIKIDTQGSELDILAGAVGILDKVDLIYTEMPIVSYNKGAPNIQDYLDFFKSHNFVPMQLLEKHYIDDILIQVDIMFMRHETKIKLFGPEYYLRPFA